MGRERVTSPDICRTTETQRRASARHYSQQFSGAIGNNLANVRIHQEEPCVRR